MSEENGNISVPHFPPYEEVRHLLRIWEGWTRDQVTGLNQTIWNLRGTPQDPVDWTEPEKWITERLDGENRELAKSIWKGSDNSVNPRYTYGHWGLITKHHLLEENSEGKLQLTQGGQEFFQSKNGETVFHLDEHEGLIALLSMVKVNQPTRKSELTESWTLHLEQHSNLHSPATVQNALHSRIKNLIERNLIERNGWKYSLTDEGSTYLEAFGGNTTASGETQEFQKQLRLQSDKTREDILGRLRNMDPIEFEYLVKFLLEKMGYENVEVTASSGDGGVDVIANIEVGITSVKEVVQVKRHNSTIPRKDVDALRGSLHRFEAHQGTLITTSRFSDNTKKSVLEKGAQPITLIDGEKLVDLMIQHEVGACKHIIYLPTPFLEFEADETRASK